MSSLLIKLARRKVTGRIAESTQQTEAARDFRAFYNLFNLTVEPHQEAWEAAFATEQNLRIAAPRNSGKTTFVMMQIAWRVGNNPNLRILVCSATSEIAKALTSCTKRILESEEYKEAFPRLLPSDQWANSAWTVKRDLLLKDPTCLAVGMGGSIASRRADIILVDDPIKSSLDIATLKARQEMQTWWHEVLSPTGGAEAKRWIICTRYRRDDIHATDFTPERGFHCITQQAIANGQSYWEKRFPLEYLQELKADNPTTFASQYQNEPVDEELIIIHPEWLKTGEAPPQFEAIAIGVDLAASQKERADYTAMVAVGRQSQQYWILVAERGRWTIHETAHRLFALHAKLETRTKRIAAAVEATAMQAALVIEFKRLAIELGSSIRIEADIPKGSKEQRLRGIAGLFEAGKVTFDCTLKAKELKAELTGFGFETHDDLADALEKALRRVFKSQKPISPGAQYRK
jgi:predicted phage terminase large subunit-like protein